MLDIKYFFVIPNCIIASEWHLIDNPINFAGKKRCLIIFLPL